MARDTEVPGRQIQFDPDSYGPMKGRSCTDIICLVLFIMMIGCSLGVAIFAYVNGDPKLLAVPKDSKGGRCGYDAHLVNKPYLFFFDLTKCLNPTVAFTGCKTTQICVSRCPDRFFMHDPSKSGYQQTRFDDLICEDNVARTNDPFEIDRLIKSQKCAQWYLPSQPVLERCVPKVTDNDTAIAYQLRDLMQSKKLEGTANDMVKTIRKNVELVGRSEQVVHDVVDDLKASWKEILCGFILSIVVCIIYIGVMRWIAAVMVWLSVLGGVASLAYCLYLCIVNYQWFKDHKYSSEATNSLKQFTDTEDFWLVMAIIDGVALGILLLMILFLRKRIILAIALIKESGKAVSSSLSTLFFPIIPWLLQLAIIFYAISVGVYLASVGKPKYEIRDFDPITMKCIGAAANFKNGATCDMKTFESLLTNCNLNPPDVKPHCRFVSMDNAGTIPYLHVFNIFCFFWGVFFVGAMGEMVLASAFATWYWTFHKHEVPFFNLTQAISRTLRYHIGTLAFGSLIIAICRMIRVLLEYIDHKLKQYDNVVTKAILCCMKCFFWCLENFLKFINRNAYIMCAIHGKNFCASAKDAFTLLVNNLVRVVVLDKITDFLFFLSKIVVTVGTSSIVYSFLVYVSEKKLNYVASPIVFIAVCAYLVSSVFFSVYTMAIDTLFLCVLEDFERNDGSAERPYYMSPGLRKVLGKRNKEL